MKPRNKTVTIQVFSPTDLAEKMKAHKLTQKRLCEIMELSRNSYTLIGRYLKGEQDIATTLPWEKFTEYLKANKLK